MKTPHNFRFGDGKYIHKHGNPHCPACRWDIPRTCPKCQKGLVHIELNPKKTGPVFLYYCDTCAGLK